MTKFRRAARIDSNQGAIVKAFEAGEAFMIGGHKVFRDMHEGADVVIPALMARIDTSIEYVKLEGRRG